MSILPLARRVVEQDDASMKIDVIVFDGFDELDALGPYEVLCNAVQGGADADVGLAAVGGPGPVTGSHGAIVHAQRAANGADLTIVPGGGWMDGNPQGLRAQIADGTLAGMLNERHAAGATVAGVCTGVMLLASAGLLEGRRAITHHGAIPDLERLGAQIVRQRVVDDGDVVTAGGVTSGLDLALDLVERYWGADLANGVAGDMEYARRS
jgi:transcriptional regulator GlxA family with amidase domain